MSIVDLFMPQGVKCIFCRKEVNGFNICDKCYENLKIIKGNVCPICGGFGDNGEDLPCSECEDKSVYFKRCYCVLSYEDDLIAKVGEIKNDKKKYYIVPFAKLMLDKFKEIDVKFDLILPIPITSDRLSDRGFNQAEELAKEINKISHKVYNNILLKSRDTQHQTGLGREERMNNLNDSFMVTDKKLVKGKVILLVDDIYTTGSTINESAKTLKDAGAKEVYALCLCRTPLLKFTNSEN